MTSVEYACKESKRKVCVVHFVRTKKGLKALLVIDYQQKCLQLLSPHQLLFLQQKTKKKKTDQRDQIYFLLVTNVNIRVRDNINLLQKKIFQ